MELLMEGRTASSRCATLRPYPRRKPPSGHIPAAAPPMAHKSQEPQEPYSTKHKGGDPEAGMRGMGGAGRRPRGGTREDKRGSVK